MRCETNFLALRNTIMLFLLLLIFGCNSAPKKQPVIKNDTSVKQKVKQEESANQVLRNTLDSKVFNQCDPNCVWQYYHPFPDSTYVIAIQNCGEEYIEKEKNTRVYFGIDRGLTDKIIWTQNVYIQPNGGGTLKHEDFDGDGIEDLLIFKETGARGSNEYHYLYLIDQQKKQVTKVQGFDDVVNPSYDQKHQVILSYGFAGKNYFSVYKISNHKVFQVGESFEDDFEGDEDILDQKILKILKEEKIK
ncbi:hypothetical protein QE439_004528 [Pedobacter agri]|nr:hypothetical protein [Pedobacter agri]